MNPTTELEFRYPWRPYQARVLAAVDRHLADQKLHVVAAPGAGKTTLGLEVFRRLGRRCLVLSPTRVIRDQWVARLKDFVSDQAWPLSWVSLDLDNPGFLTSITYQALHTRYRETLDETDADDDAPDAKEVDTLVTQIRDADIGILVLDEAHHLRDEWWKALTTVAEAIDNLQLIALTATPPYDVTNHEWAKYQALCGPIDEEISIPELVQAGTLCPHQDFVWFVALSASKRDQLRDYDNAVAKICDELSESRLFRHAIETHPWLGRDDSTTTELLDNPELTFALLIFLAAHEQPLPFNVLTSLDVDSIELPGLDRRWWQVLVYAFLFHPSFELSKPQREFQDALAKRLRAQELLVRRELRLNESKPIKRMLALASEKIAGIIDIHRLEREVRGGELRQVILTDFIRDEEGVTSLRHGTESLGAWPIFREFLRRGDGVTEQRHIAILTGRLVSLHVCHLPAIQNFCDGETLDSREAPFHPEFVVLKAGVQTLTNALTQLLGEGELQLLIGTRALLGEGWDAPSINSLVLASFVGSFMLTNQMRGRAIRIDPKSPDKVASIWHLVAVDGNTESGLADLNDLRDRFATFVGLHVRENRIEGGLKRLPLPFGESSYQGLIKSLSTSVTNKEMGERLDALPLTATRWRQATTEGLEHRIVPAVQSAPLASFKSLYFGKTLKLLALEILGLFVAGASYVGQTLGNVSTEDYRVALIVLGLAALVGFLVALPKTVKTFLFWWRHLPIDGSIRQIALALRDALSDADLIQTDPRRLSVRCEEAGGAVTVALIGATFYEQSLFSDSLNELLGPVKSPRYLITRHEKGKLDYHAVPALLGARKRNAERLYQAWLKRVSASELIYTRQAGGRELLLKARTRTFANNYVNETQRVDRWQ